MVMSSSSVRRWTLSSIRADPPPPNCIKIDVEGAEADVLRGATRTLAEVRPVVFLATHGKAVREECIALLTAADYSVHPIPELANEFIATAHERTGPPMSASTLHA
ncbi:MAG: FkbM family methyltransferase [Longimicrobiales bacterium]